MHCFNTHLISRFFFNVYFVGGMPYKQALFLISFYLFFSFYTDTVLAKFPGTNVSEVRAVIQRKCNNENFVFEKEMVSSNK